MKPQTLPWRTSRQIMGVRSQAVAALNTCADGATAEVDVKTLRNLIEICDQADHTERGRARPEPIRSQNALLERRAAALAVHLRTMHAEGATVVSLRTLKKVRNVASALKAHAGPADLMALDIVVRDCDRLIGAAVTTTTTVQPDRLKGLGDAMHACRDLIRSMA